MRRVALPVAIGIVLYASSAWAVDVAQEVAAIQATFSTAVKALNSTADDNETKRAAFAKAIEERNAALSKLAETAEAEKSTEHAPLARLYLQLIRPADSLRHAQALVGGGTRDPASYSLLVQSLTAGEKADEAAAALRDLLKLELDEKSAGPYLLATPNAVSAVFRAFMSVDKLDAAESVLNDWQAKLEDFQPEEASLKQTTENLGRSLRGMRQQLAATKARAALIGQQYFPLAEPTWLNGEPISPGELRGKVVLLDFWAVWCGPCIATFPHLIEWHDKYADKGLVIIGVTKRYHFDWDAEAKRGKPVGELPPEKEDAATTEFAKHHGLKHRLAIMADNAASQQYGVSGIPQVVVIDQGGIIRLIKVGSGEKNAAAVEAEIRKLLGLESAAASK